MGRSRRSTPPEIRFWRHVDKAGSAGCWLWTGGTNGKYGVFAVDASRATPARDYAHRFSYAIANGPIPRGLVINHLCMTPLCVNPDHLEAVTPSENSRYGDGPAARKARQTHCIHGHLLDGVKPNGSRRCNTCAKLSERAKRARLRERQT